MIKAGKRLPDGVADLGEGRPSRHIAHHVAKTVPSGAMERPLHRRLKAYLVDKPWSSSTFVQHAPTQRSLALIRNRSRVRRRE